MQLVPSKVLGTPTVYVEALDAEGEVVVEKVESEVTTPAKSQLCSVNLSLKFGRARVPTGLEAIWQSHHTE